MSTRGSAIPARPRPDACPASGKRWEEFDSRGQCPSCGRMVRRTRDGEIPAHKPADAAYLRRLERNEI